MASKPKERVIYDKHAFAGEDGIELAAADLMARNGITAEAVREQYTDDELSPMPPRCGSGPLTTR